MNKPTAGINTRLWQSLLKSGADELGIDIDDTQIHLLRCFADELLAANQAVNLTSVTDPLEIAEKLMLDSMMPGRFIHPGSAVLDLGTGAGFPGIPLKIAFPGLLLTLVDSKRKRINFVKFIIRALNLTEITAKLSRAEELSHISKSALSFDAVVSRAVSSLDRLFSLSIPFVKKNGIIIAMKGDEPTLDSELNDFIAAKKSYPEANIRVFPYQLPISKKKRSLVLIRSNL